MQYSPSRGSAQWSQSVGAREMPEGSTLYATSRNTVCSPLRTDLARSFPRTRAQSRQSSRAARARSRPPSSVSRGVGFTSLAS